MLKLALLQCDVKTGDPLGNAAKLLDLCRMAPDADLLIAPLEALAGPDAGCFAREPDFTEKLRQCYAFLAANMPGNAALLCGSSQQNIVLASKGGVTPVSQPFAFRGVMIGIDAEPENLEGISINISLASRPFRINSQMDWELVMSGVARQGDFWAVAMNLVGGYGQQIYSGQSFAMSPNGEIVGRAKAFAEDCLLIDLADPASGRIEPAVDGIEEAQWQALVLGLKDFMAKNGGQKALIGLSGGMDSALVACIATEALGAANVTGALMSSRYTSPESVRDARELAENLGIAAYELSIEPMVAAYMAELTPIFEKIGQAPGNLMAENLQARIRGVALMALANAYGAFVLNTGNKSEAAMGYSTLYGDTVGAIAVIGDLFKTEVYKLAAWYCKQRGKDVIPRNIFDRPPSAELAPNQKDSDSMPPYEELDPVLAGILAFSDQSASGGEAQAIRRRIRANGFKRRQSPPALIISNIRPCQGK